MKYTMSSIDNHHSGEKFYRLKILLFVLRKPLKVFTTRREYFPLPSWNKFCTALFGFDFSEDDVETLCDLILDSTGRSYYDYLLTGLNGLDEKPEWLLEDVPPEPIWSHWLARVTISCIQYLRCRDPNDTLAQTHLRACAKKSKQMPWLWRQRMRVTSTGRRLDLDFDLPRYSFSQSLPRLPQILHSGRIQPEKFYQTHHRFYILTLSILSRTLHWAAQAKKSDELIKELSNPFIPSSATLLSPLRVKRVKKAVDAYLAKVRRSSDPRSSRIPADMSL
jgi:hypothetical protein